MGHVIANANGPHHALSAWLFVCQFNSARSQIGEAVARARAGPRIEALSAGLTATVVNDRVRSLLIAGGFDPAPLASKSLRDVADRRVTDVFILAREAADAARAAFPTAEHHAHYMPDPILAGDPHAVDHAILDTIERLRAIVDSRLSEVT